MVFRIGLTFILVAWQFQRWRFTSYSSYRLRLRQVSMNQTKFPSQRHKNPYILPLWRFVSIRYASTVTVALAGVRGADVRKTETKQLFLNRRSLFLTVWITRCSTVLLPQVNFYYLIIRTTYQPIRPKSFAGLFTRLIVFSSVDTCYFTFVKLVRFSYQTQLCRRVPILNNVIRLVSFRVSAAEAYFIA